VGVPENLVEARALSSGSFSRQAELMAVEVAYYLLDSRC
jgi:hypothetical protein